MRSVRKTKIRIFSRMNRVNWSVRALLYCHNKRPKPSLNSELNVFVSFLNATVGRETVFSNSPVLNSMLKLRSFMVSPACNDTKAVTF